MTFPPRTLPRPLASLGSANSEYSDADSRTGLPSSGLPCIARGFPFPAQVAAGVSASLAREQGGAGLPACLDRILQRSVAERVMIALHHVIKPYGGAIVSGNREAHGVGTVTAAITRREAGAVAARIAK